MATSIPKDETGLKSKQVKAIKLYLPTYLAIRHEDVRTCGTPDMSLSGNGKTSWWEFKHATPNFSTTGIQELTCSQLAIKSFCRYVFYYEDVQNTVRTYIIHPRAVINHKGNFSAVLANAILTDINWRIGFDFKWITEQMRLAHES